MLNLFFDTSALVKLFHQEEGSDRIIQLMENEDTQVWISELAKLEFISALHRRFRMKELNESQLYETLSTGYCNY